jgi:CxxC motif-containing protein
MFEGVITTTGHKCQKGLEFAEREWFFPMRTLTTTLKTNDEKIRRIPVRTTREIPKQKIMEAMIALDDVVVTLPITIGRVIVRNLLDLDVDVIATFTMQTVQKNI